MSAPSRILQAVALSLTGILLLDLMGVLIKILSARYPAQELSMFRNIFGLVPVLLLLWGSTTWHREGRRMRFRGMGIAWARGLAVTLAQLSFYTGLAHMQFATCSALAFTMPLFVTALSVPLLGHRVGWVRWAAVATGFAGALLILGPGTDAFSPWAVLPVLAAIGYATSTVTVRLIPDDVPLALINLHSTVSALLGATVLMLAGPGFTAVASLQDAGMIAAMGCLGGTGVICVVAAYRMAEPGTLAPFDFFGVLFALTLGWIVFDEWPLDRLFPGVLLIVGAGVAIALRERRLARAAT